MPRQVGTDHSPSQGQSRRQIQVVLHRFPKLLPPLLGFRRQGGHFRQIFPFPHPVPQVGQGLFGGFQGIKGKVHPMAVAHRHTKIAESQRVNAPANQVVQQENIARGFSHFRPVGQQMLAVYPVVDMDAAESPLALGDFILVMGENVIHAAGMQVKTLAQILAGHGGTFDMPTGKALAPGTGPLYISTRLRSFPQGKVPGIPLQGVSLRPHSLQQIAAEVAGQAAVLGKLRHRKIDIAAGLVSVALGQQPPHQVNHFRDVLGGPRVGMGR